MGTLKQSVNINASGDVVFDLLTDLDRLPHWSTITVETHGTPRQPIAQGDSFTQTLRVLGTPIEAEWRVVEVDHPTRIAYETTAPGGGRLRMSQTVLDREGACEVEFEVDYDLPRDLEQLLEIDYAERRNERELEHSLQNLKDLAEARTRRR